MSGRMTFRIFVITCCPGIVRFNGNILTFGALRCFFVHPNQELELWLPLQVGFLYLLACLILGDRTSRSTIIRCYTGMQKAHHAGHGQNKFYTSHDFTILRCINSPIPCKDYTHLPSLSHRSSLSAFSISLSPTFFSDLLSFTITQVGVLVTLSSLRTAFSLVSTGTVSKGTRRYLCPSGTLQGRLC